MKFAPSTLLVFVFSFCISQNPPKKSWYNYQEAFAIDFYSNNGTASRSFNGSPSADYWQNKVDYAIKSSLNVVSNEIIATSTLTYTNNSPDALSFLWFHLEQNLFKQDSRGQLVVPLSGSRNGGRGQIFDAGYKIKSIKLVSDSKSKNSEISIPFEVYDTRMQVFLPESIKAKGGKVSLKMEYSYISPNEGSDRTGVLETKNGKIFTIAQWYPRLCVYDDIKGWNTDPYLGASEFYLEYGNFDVAITVPTTYLVVSSGELTNAPEVFSSEEFNRFNAAKNSNSTVFIRTANEVAALPKTDVITTKTWRFKLTNSRDFSWAASAAFILDGAKVSLPSGKKSLALSAYPIESAGSDAWGRSTEYVKGAIENYSKRWMEYTYPVAVNVAGNEGGMEYPGIVFCSWKSKGDRLWGVTDHEFGHNWFPMIVGSNERLYGWMDEGFNTFINTLSGVDFNNAEYKEDKEDLHRTANSYTNASLEAVYTTPDVMKEKNIGTLCYSKPSAALVILREQILGEERFDKAFKTYMERWAFKHPAPDDFFRTMENVSGENLGWFWRSWFKNNWKFDQGVTSLKYIRNSPENGAIIAVENFEKMPLPIIAEIKTRSGKISRVKLPVEVWQKNTQWSFKVPTNEEILTITLDPDHVFPDSDTTNNVWKSDSNTVEKAPNLAVYAGKFTTKLAPIIINFVDTTTSLKAHITNYPEIGLEYLGNNLFEAKEAGVQFQFNEQYTTMELILENGQKILFTRE